MRSLHNLSEDAQSAQATASSGYVPIAFDVCDVKLASAPLPEVPYREAIAALLSKRSSEYYELQELGYAIASINQPPSWAEQARREGYLQTEEIDHLVKKEIAARHAEFEKLIERRDLLVAIVQAQSELASNRLEACSRYYGKLVAGVDFHPVVAAVHLAFADHRPLVLSPDMLWLLLTQGLANHINANAEEMRPKVVAHQGKVKLTVRRDDFVLRSPENPWAEVFDEFADQIRTHLGVPTYDLLLPAFSTTGRVERAATQIVLLDALQSYFSYEFHTLCGIPQIVLEGTVDDWKDLALRTQEFDRFGLEWWTQAIIPLLEEFIDAAQGRVNVQFWRSIYKQENRSGGPYTTGWITAFFPYLKDTRTNHGVLKNPWIVRGGKVLQELLFPDTFSDDHFDIGPTTEAFPGGMSQAPFHWKYYDNDYEMLFLGGFVGIGQDVDTLRLRPEIGWAIQEMIT